MPATYDTKKCSSESFGTVYLRNFVFLNNFMVYEIDEGRVQPFRVLLKQARRGNYQTSSPNNDHTVLVKRSLMNFFKNTFTELTTNLLARPRVLDLVGQRPSSDDFSVRLTIPTSVLYRQQRYSHYYHKAKVIDLVGH